MKTKELFVLSYLHRPEVIEKMLQYSQFSDIPIMLSFVDDYIASQLTSNGHMLNEMVHLESFYLETAAHIFSRFCHKVSKSFLKFLSIYIVLFSFNKLIVLHQEKSLDVSQLSKRVRNPYLYTMH